MIKFGIYMIINVENNKIYIGSTGKTVGFNRRWSGHKFDLNSNKHVNSHLQNAWNKYGKENFEFRVIEECQEQILIQREQAWINFYKSRNDKFGYNIREAGPRGKWSEESKKKLSLSNKGRKPWNTGKHLSKEHKEKVSSSLMGHACWGWGSGKGVPRPLSVRKKISNSHIGISLSNKHKKSLKAAWKNRSHTFSKETREKMSRAMKRIRKVKKW